MYDRFAYSNTYFNAHDNHVMNTLANVLRDTLTDATVFVNNNRTVSVYGDVDYNVVDTVVDLFGNSVHDTDVDGFFNDAYVLYFNVALVDVDDF